MPIASRYSSRARTTGARKHGLGGSTSDIHAALSELLSFNGAGWVVSCYQKLEPADRAGEKYRIKLKNRLRRAEDRMDILGFSRAEREHVSEALARIEEFFQHPSNLAGGRGVALFAADGLLRAVRMPYVLRSRILVDRSPVVGELVALADAGTRLLVAVADRRNARLFDASLDSVEELESIVDESSTRNARFHGQIASAPGVGEYRFHNRIREEKQRHLARVADSVARAFRSRPFDGIAVGGIGVAADALMPFLDTDLRDKVLGVLRLSPKSASAGEIRERAMELLSESAEHSAADAVGEVVALTKSGWAVDGVEHTLRALARGQVRTLVVDHDAAIPGYRFAASGRLSESGSATRSDGEAIPVADLLDDAIEDALRQRARVAVARGQSARRFDRLAGILRFRSAR